MAFLNLFDFLRPRNQPVQQTFSPVQQNFSPVRNFSPAGRPVASSVTGGSIFQSGNRQYVAPIAPSVAIQKYGSPITTPSGGGGGAPAPSPIQTAPSSPFQPESVFSPQPTQQANDENLAVIEQHYQNTLSQLAAEEQRLQGELPQTIGGVERSQAATRAALQQEQGGRLSRITAREQQQQQATSGALEQLRQLFTQTQRQQTANLAAQGISRSSVGEAFATILGREMAQRVAGENATREQVLGSLSDERRRTEDYFATQNTNLEQDTQAKIQEANLQFRNALNQLATLRGQAGVAKQQARADLFGQYQQQIFAIQQANYNAKQSLETFRQNMALRLQTAQQMGLNLTPAQTGFIENAFSQLQPQAQATQPSLFARFAGTRVTRLPGESEEDYRRRLGQI